MSSRPTDAELIARSLQSADAFSELFTRHGPTVHRYLTRRVGRATGDELASHHRPRTRVRARGAMRRRSVPLDRAAHAAIVEG